MTSTPTAVIVGMSSNSDVHDGLNPAMSSASTSRRTNTSVRPRNRRLISVNDDGDEENPQALASRFSSSLAGLTPPQSRGSTPSPYASQKGSPRPQKQFSRVTERDIGSSYRSSEDGYGGQDGLKLFDSSQTSSGFLESSWSSFQSLASSVIGGEVKWGKSSSNSIASSKRRKPSRSDVPVSLSRPPATSSWGPLINPTPQIGTGTKEERQAMVQAKKREVLLLANGDSLSDLRDRYKRKDSIETPDVTMDPEQDEEALVYIHHVQPSDTMTGLSIKYGCQLAILRKANGFWPSDSVQTRRIVLLPSEACSVKGRRVKRADNNLDLLGDEAFGEGSQEDPAGSSIVPSESLGPVQREGQTKNDGENERTWKHEAWVEMEGFSGPVEIGRVPRKTLGFFPRSRRKSLSFPYSDAEPSTPPATSSTLKPIDSSSPSRLYQRDNSPYRSISPSRMTSRTQSPLKGNGRPSHRRTGSITLQGPGGVGTLGREVHAPGPAQDGLSKFVAQHLPNLTVPPPPAPSGLRKSSFDSTSSVLSGTSSTGLENVGGAIEGWMRKMALRAKTSLNELQQGGFQQTTSQGQALGIAGLGDLIELNDGLEGSNAQDGALLSSGNINTESRHGRRQATSNYSQYERYSNSPSSRTRTRPRVVQDGTRKDD